MAHALGRLTREKVSILSALGALLLPIAGAYAQVTYAPIQASGIIVTGIRSSSTTSDAVVISGSYLSAAPDTTAVLYLGPLSSVATAPLSSWTQFTPTFSPPQVVTSATFYGPDTPLFDPTLAPGSVRAVGSYKIDGLAADYGMMYAGPASGIGGAWVSLIPTSLVAPGDSVLDTIAHSTMGNLVVGNYDTRLATGHAFVYNISGNSFAPLAIPTPMHPLGAQSVTAYGIWENKDGSLTIAGGLSDVNFGGVDEAYLADYDPSTGAVIQSKMYTFDNEAPSDSIFTHFDGITGNADGTGYNLTGVYCLGSVSTCGADDTPTGAFFASIPRLADGEFGDATWTNIAFTNPDFQDIEFTTGNTVIDNSVLGIFQGDALPCGSCVPVTLSYLATVPEPGALPLLAAGIVLLGLIRLRVSARS